MITPAPLELWNGTVCGLAEDSEGRLIAAGGTDSQSFGLLRYLEDGSLDLTFTSRNFEPEDPLAPGGLVETNFGGGAFALDIAIQRNGRIVAAGAASAGFGQDSFASFALARYDEDGRRDRNFGKHGRVITRLGENDGGAFALAIQPNGKILVAGFRETRTKRTEGLLIRYRPNGAIDRRFGSHGEVHFATRGHGQASLHDVAVLPSGKILLAGGFHGSFMLAKLRADGSPDRSFGDGDGRILTDVDGSSYCASGQCAYANSLALKHSKITLAGNAGDERAAYAVVTRYRANGRLDRGFGEQGVVRARRGTVLYSEQMVLQHDGRIVLAGRYNGKAGYQIAALRFLPNGEPDPSFGHAGFFTSPIGYASAAFAALVQRDGKLVIGGFVKPRAPRFQEIEYPPESPHFTLMRFR